jgi:hypothetical protein
MFYNEKKGQWSTTVSSGATKSRSMRTSKTTSLFATNGKQQLKMVFLSWRYTFIGLRVTFVSPQISEKKKEALIVVLQECPIGARGCRTPSPSGRKRERPMACDDHIHA